MVEPGLVVYYGDGVETREPFGHHYLNLMVEPGLVVYDGDGVESPSVNITFILWLSPVSYSMMVTV